MGSVFKEPLIVVITSLGHNRTGSSPHCKAGSHTNIPAAMRARGIRRVVLPALGVGRSKPNLFVLEGGRSSTQAWRGVLPIMIL
ncbi:hypothetical protein HO173_003632 [Letharia columbiana]|uniref:Uncharacterized protein n=1 Tax=Letharia columbiana TaxID=112416 RepID=A0A8H6G103_9LECA|nr:uncharacterized protein HO173_003632 [Letharia columbiana]KAF6238352.1 hypothetical protein HO173_003632 [Letharia columbiana]